ncbi:MAG: ABC transporter permease [Cyclobacteriaceae bacterium]
MTQIFHIFLYIQIVELMLDYPWTDIVIASTLVLGSLAGLLLITTKYPGSRFLGQLVFSYLLVIVFALVDNLSSWWWMGLTILAISFFLYCKAFFLQKNRIAPYHVIPPSLVAMSLFFMEREPLVFKGLTVVFTIGYLIFAILFLKKEAVSRGISWFGNPGSRLIWFRNFVVLNILFILCWLLIPNPSVQLQVAMVFALLSFVYFQVFRESAFLSPIPLGNKYQKSTLSPEIKSMILGKLDVIFEQENFHLRDDASLTTLAQELGATTHHLSQVLNESKKISFQDLLAQHRIREACRLLKEDDQSNIKIENIASMVGYNSKSAFNTAFKKRTGKTPSEYRDGKGVSSYREERLSERKTPSEEDRAFSLIKILSLKLKRGMVINFFKVFYRNLMRNRLFSAINLFGLAIAFTCSILIYLFISDEQSFDQELSDYDRIHRVSWISDNPQTRTPHPMAQAMVKDLPEVEAAVSISPWYGPGLSRDLIRVKNVEKNILFEEPDFYFADSTFFDVFDLELIEGDAKALSKPWTLVISEEMAAKYFGNSSAIGKELIVNDMPIAVTTVVKGMPKNSHFHFSALIPYVTLKSINPDDGWLKWPDFGHFNYIKITPGTDRIELESRIPEWVVGYLDWPQERIDGLIDGSVGFELQPVADIHLNSHLRWELENNGNILYVYILTATLAFLLLIAAINYVNLTTAKSMERAREIGVRKTLGAVSVNLSFQFYLESIFFCLMALILALGTTFLLIDGFNFLSGKAFGLSDILNTNFILKLIGLSVVVGVLAGFYPAVALSSFKPAEVLKGKLTTSSRGIRMRGILVITQFVVSAILIAGSLIILRQIDYMKNKELGFDQQAVISIRIPESVELGGINLSETRSMQAQIEAVPGVLKTSTVSNLPGGQFNQHPMYAKKNPENQVDISEMMVSFDVEEVFDFEILQGRTFARNYAADSAGLNFILNESAISQLNLKEPIGEKLVWIDNENLIEGTIIGVVKDFHYRSLHEEIQPLLIQLDEYDAGQLVVKMEGTNFQKVLDDIALIYQTTNSDFPFEFQFLDQQLAELYQSEIKTLSIFSVFAVVALILASLGLLGMAIAMLNQRIKEVGMRKILGASSSQIMRMIFAQFAKLILISLLIGLPISHIVMQNWISEFSYQAPFGVMPYVWSGLVLLIVAIISVSSAVFRIAFSNPADALRYE